MKKNKPVKKEKSTPKSIFGCMKGTLKIHGDIMSTGEEWYADLPDTDPTKDPQINNKGRLK